MIAGPDFTRPPPPEAIARAGTATVATFEVHLPIDAPVTVATDDVFVVVASRDPELVGMRLRARVDPAKTWRTARRYNCEAVVA